MYTVVTKMNARFFFSKQLFLFDGISLKAAENSRPPQSDMKDLSLMQLLMEFCRLKDESLFKL